MTIEKGQPWGHSIVVPTTTRDVDSDWQLARGNRDDIHILLGGDLHSTLGKPTGITPGQTRTLVQIDAVECTLKNESGTGSVLASATIEIGRWVSAFRRHRFIVLTNGGLLDGSHVAPRAHPNDGCVDVMSINSSMPWRDRVLSKRRARTGAHLPHPHITVNRGDTFTFVREYKREKLLIDGQEMKSWKSVEIKVLPDYWQVIV